MHYVTMSIIKYFKNQRKHSQLFFNRDYHQCTSRGQNLEGEAGAKTGLQKWGVFQMLGKLEGEKHRGKDRKADSPTKL